LNISREHFLIEHQNGNYFIVDRGSSCGTIVEGTTLGDKRQSVSRKLENQDVIIVGSSRSKFVFKFLLKNP
jgi:predicted component of type VI protein secretion system